MKWIASLTFDMKLQISRYFHELRSKLKDLDFCRYTSNFRHAMHCKHFSNFLKKSETNWIVDYPTYLPPLEQTK